MDAAVLHIISYALGAVHLLEQLYDFNVEGWDILLPRNHAHVCFHNVAKKLRTRLLYTMCTIVFNMAQFINLQLL